jgi:hypothetical protein
MEGSYTHILVHTSWAAFGLAMRTTVLLLQPHLRSGKKLGAVGARLSGRGGAIGFGAGGILLFFISGGAKPGEEGARLSGCAGGGGGILLFLISGGAKPGEDGARLRGRGGGGSGAALSSIRGGMSSPRMGAVPERTS